MKEAKRHIIDSLGCAMGGTTSEPAVIARPCRAGLGRGRRRRGSWATDARPHPKPRAFASSVMIRFLDANDTHITRGSGRPGDMLGAILAAAELRGASGRDFLLATVAGYEVFGALADHVALRDRGWDQGLRMAPASAAGAGLAARTLRAGDGRCDRDRDHREQWPRDQTRAGEAGDVERLCDRGGRPRPGLFAAQLAKAGMTGPTCAFRGRHGLLRAGDGAIQARGSRRRRTRLRDRCARTSEFFAAEYHAQAPLADARLPSGTKVRVERSRRLDVQIYAMAHSEIGSEPAKWDPQTRETADRSLPYMLAVALVDGRITPASFEPKRYLDPSLRPIMNRIRVAENPELTRPLPRRATLADRR